MHRLLFVLAALGLASCATRPYSSSSPETKAAYQAYAQCFEDKGALLASNKTDPAEALARAVARFCQPQEDALRWALTRENEGTAHPVVYVESSVSLAVGANSNLTTYAN